MKWFFFILLLANLGMFILIYPQKAEKSIDNALPDVGELYLYEELAALNDEPVATGAIQAPGNEKAGAETEAVQLRPGEPAENLGIDRPELEQSETMPDTADVPVASQDEKKAFSEGEDRMRSDALASAEEAQPVAAPVCRMVGYLETRSDAEIVSVNLRAMGFKPELQSETRNEQAGIWVLIPPQTSRRKAINIANRLEQDGITDLWRFTSGELVHAISLGLFRNLERAEARKKEIEDLGYEVIIQPRYRQQTQYWLYFHEDTPLSEVKDEWDGLLVKFPDIEIKKVACR